MLKPGGGILVIKIKKNCMCTIIGGGGGGGGRTYSANLYALVMLAPLATGVARGKLDSDRLPRTYHSYATALIMSVQKGT